MDDFSTQLSSAAAEKTKSSRRLTDPEQTPSQENRLREYYDSYDAFAFKDGYGYAAWFYLIVSIVLMILFGTQIRPPFEETDLYLCVFIYGCFSFLALKSIYELRRLRHLKDYDRIMAQCQEAELPLEILADKAGVSFRRAGRDLRWLFKKGLMRHCSLILDEKPRLVLTDLLLDIYFTKDMFCPECPSSQTQIGPGSTVRCPACGRIFDPVQSENNDDPAAAWEGRNVYEWNCQDLWQYADPFRIKHIRNISSVLYFMAVIITALMAGLFDPIWSLWGLGFDEIAKTAVIPAIGTGIVLGLVFLIRFLRRPLELALRCDPFFFQSISCSIPCENIASMMGWSVSATEKTLRLCLFLKVLENCSCQDGFVMLEQE